MHASSSSIAVWWRTSAESGSIRRGSNPSHHEFGIGTRQASDRSPPAFSQSSQKSRSASRKTRSRCGPPARASSGVSSTLGSAGWSSRSLGEVDRSAVGKLLRPRVDDLSRDLPHRPARLQRGPGSVGDLVGEHREDERPLGRRQDPRVGPHAVHRPGLSGPADPGAGEEEARDPVPRSRVLREAKREAARLLVEERPGRGPAPELGGVTRGHPAERLPGLVRLARAEARNPSDELDPGEAGVRHPAVHRFRAEGVDEVVRGGVVGEDEHDAEEVPLRRRQARPELVEDAGAGGHRGSRHQPPVGELERPLAAPGERLDEEGELDDARPFERLGVAPAELAPALDVERDDSHPGAALLGVPRDAPGERLRRREDAQRRGRGGCAGGQEREDRRERRGRGAPHAGRSSSGAALATRFLPFVFAS